jgi:hypothetical protein
MVEKKENATTGKKENAASNSERGRLLRDDELEAVSGGATTIEYGAAVLNPIYKP